MPKFVWPLVGHSLIVKYLQSVIDNNKLNHAYLFHSPADVGKKLIIDYFIKSIFCTAQENIPCGHCMHYQQIHAKAHPDIIYLNKEADKKNITVEQVREAKNKIQLSTFLDSYKIVVIEQADKLSISGSNSLLKILEEPTPKTIFILSTTNLKNILPTILSRVQLIKFLPVSINLLQKYFIKLGLDQVKAYELSRLSAGFPGKVIPLLNHSKLLSEYKEEYITLLKDLSGNVNCRFKLIERLAAQSKSELAKVNTTQFLENMLFLVRDALLVKNKCFDKIVCSFIKQELTIFASKYSIKQLANLLNKIKHTQKLISANVNLRLALETLILNF